jgi:hypothetical protein
MKVLQIKAPGEVDGAYVPKIFLAGSIDMGSAPNWQEQVVERLKQATPALTVIAYNPRRNDWDSSWEQSVNNPQFLEQVTWELDHIDASDIVFFYFAPGSHSPITLLELGLCLGKGRRNHDMIVVCPEGYERKGNVDITCALNYVEVFDNMDEGLTALISSLVNAYGTDA